MINSIKGRVWQRVEIANHLGMNPVRGGIPLNDSSIIGKASCMIGDILFILLNWELLCWLFLFISMKRGMMIDEYMM